MATPLDTPAGQAVLTPTTTYDGKPGHEVHRGTQAGRPIGVVAKRRHTYRRAYAGSRIGYDRQHMCWSGDMHPVAVPDGGPRWPRSVQCQPTRLAAVTLMLQEYDYATRA